MPEPDPGLLQRERAVPRWGFLGVSALLILSLIAWFSLPRNPGITLTAREEASSGERAYVVSVQAPRSAERIDLPRLGVRSRLSDGRGEFLIRENELPPGDGRLGYVLREPWYRPDQRGTARIEGLPVAREASAEPDEWGTEPDGAPAASLPRPPLPAPSSEEMPAAPDEAIAPALPPSRTAPEETSADPETTLAPPAATPPVVPRPAWARDRALESELAGRGVSGVRILRRGRSIRLRGAVGTDKALRTVYQFMNDKGFGEVDYGVEVR